MVSRGSNGDNHTINLKMMQTPNGRKKKNTPMNSRIQDSTVGRVLKNTSFDMGKLAFCRKNGLLFPHPGETADKQARP